MIPAYTEHDSHQYVSHHRPGSPVCQERTVIPHIHNPEIIQEISSHLNQKCCRTPCSHQHSELISLSEGYPQETEQQEQEKRRRKEDQRRFPLLSGRAVQVTSPVFLPGCAGIPPRAVCRRADSVSPGNRSGRSPVRRNVRGEA